MESFILPEKFEAMLGIRRTCTRQDTAVNFVSRIPFEDQCVSKAILGIQTIKYDHVLAILVFCVHTVFKNFLIYYLRYNNTVEMTPCISSCTESTTKLCNMVTPFLAHIMVRCFVFFNIHICSFLQYANCVFFIRLNKQVIYICLHKDLCQIRLYLANG